MPDLVKVGPQHPSVGSSGDESPVRVTFRAERLRPAAQLMQNKLADWRAEVRSGAELGGQACSLRQIFADQLAKLASGLRTEVSLRKNLEYATSHED